jgi:hypothetical protein
VAVLTQDDRRLALLRTSVGQARTLTGPDLHYVDARWSSDGRALIVRGHTSDGPLRFWRQDLADGAVTPLTPRPVDGEFVRVRGRDYVLAAGETGGVLLYPGSGGPPSPVRGLGAPDDVLGGSHLDDALFVLDKASRYDWDLQKLDIPTGHRHSVAHLEPIGDAATLYTSHFARIADDDRTIVYTQQHVMSVLYFVEGLR